MRHEHTNTVGHEADGKGLEPMNACSNPVAEICLYGTHQTGAGYILSIHAVGKIVRLGTGEPTPGRSFTEAIWTAVGLLQVAGFHAGIVHVYEPKGQKVAAFGLSSAVPTFGDLAWTDGDIGYELDVTLADMKALAADQRDGGARFEGVQNRGIDY